MLIIGTILFQESKHSFYKAVFGDCDCEQHNPGERLYNVTHLGSIWLSVMVFAEDWVLDSGWKLCPGKPDLLSSELPELINGGWVGWGISWLWLTILTTTDIDGLNSAVACAQSSPIWSSWHASSAGNGHSRVGSTISDSLFDPYSLQTLHIDHQPRDATYENVCLVKKHYMNSRWKQLPFVGERMNS